jgi:hypothetical protein
MPATLKINDPSLVPFDALGYLGVVIKRVGDEQQHIGILYRLDDAVAMMYHLGWHYDLRHHTPSADYYWLESSLDEDTRRVTAIGIQSAIERGKPKIRYSPNYDGVYFEANTLKYVRDEPGDGLTCATFVLATFGAFGLQILDTSSWAERTEDQAWKNHIVGQLELKIDQYGDDLKYHIDVIRKSPWSPRFRPEEVAAGVADPDAPLSFAHAEAQGKMIAQAIP